MSSDLLKEFGTSAESNTIKQSESINQVTADDDFGDFEEPETGNETPQSHMIHGQWATASISASNNQSVPNLSYGQVGNALSQRTPPDDGTAPNVIPGKRQANNSIFFDAENIIAEESRIHYQGQTKTHKPLPQKPMKVSLLPIDSTDRSTLKVTRGKGNREEQNDFDEDDSWEPMTIPQDPIVPDQTTKSKDQATMPGAVPTAISVLDKKALGPPPSNIPPPSILLSLVTTVLQPVLNNARVSTTANIAAQQSADQSQLDHVVALAFARAGARIIAGRKLRWKRDNILAQSMKIGPAGKSGGMKLTGVDKTESRREDQEAAEAIRAWGKQVGPLRSAVSRANVSMAGNRMNVPEISDNIPIRLIKPSEGAVSAPKCCFLCGVKRDERVTRVDVDVEDSFSEWWMEHWGHVDCVVFWDYNKSLLKQR